MHDDVLWYGLEDQESTPSQPGEFSLSFAAIVLAVIGWIIFVEQNSPGPMW
jgi:hypothetical protein